MVNLDRCNGSWNTLDDPSSNIYLPKEAGVADLIHSKNK